MEQILADGWGIWTDHIEKIQHNVWKIRTEEGDFALKRSELKEKNLGFICRAESSLTNHGFHRFAKLIPQKRGELYYSTPNGSYTLHRWLNGEKCDFQNSDHLYAAANTLADFHLRGKDKTLQQHSGNRTNYFDRAERMSLRIEELHHFFILANTKPQTAFSELYQYHYPHFLSKAQEAKWCLLCSAYPRLTAEAKAMGSFIHYDVAARNFIIRNNAAYLIDFDYCCCDLPLTDLMRLIKRGLKQKGDEEEKITAILKGYQNYRNLTTAEFDVLFALLLFPQKFWRIAHRYYAEKKIREESFYLNKLSAAISELEQENQWLPLLKEKSEEYH